MPKYFVCEESGMGGVDIVFATGNRVDCCKFVAANPNRNLYIYQIQSIYDFQTK